MLKIDLITGFLGSGKTTFIRRYASYLIAQGERVGILENDFGAVNVDMMLLGDIEGEQCGLEMVAAGCGQEPGLHKRRFAAKLIGMKMDGYDRVIVEPSGIYEVDEFFDALRDEPLESWYEIGNVIALVDAGLEEELSPEAEYLLASQISCAGALVITKSGDAPAEQIERVKAHVERALAATLCRRKTDDFIVICRDTDALTDGELGAIASCGYVMESCARTIFRADQAFNSLYYMHPGISAGRLEEAVRQIFADPACGQVMRVKGFLKDGEAWMEMNATPREVDFRPIPRGQEIIIVIGQGLDQGRIAEYLES